MPKQSSRLPDPNVFAFSLVGKVTGEKNPAAVALGRLGGLKGGKARAASLSKKERSMIASKAAAARWASKSRKGR